MSALSELTAQHFKGPRYDNPDYITCDLPIKGTRVWVRSMKRKGLVFRKRVEGNATVTLHYHYDGCSISVEMDDGTHAAVFPTMGDDIVPLDGGPPSVLERAAAIYASAKDNRWLGANPIPFAPPPTHTSDGSPRIDEIDGGEQTQ